MLKTLSDNKLAPTAVEVGDYWPCHMTGIENVNQNKNQLSSWS
jgi:hypothetical protein